MFKKVEAQAKKWFSYKKKYLYKLKNLKNIYRELLLLIKLQGLACNLTKRNTLPRVFLAFFKLYKMVPKRSMHHIFFLSIIPAYL